MCLLRRGLSRRRYRPILTLAAGPPHAIILIELKLIELMASNTIPSFQVEALIGYRSL